MSISGIVGQGVSTQTTSGILQRAAGLGGRVIGIFQNKYLAAAALGVALYALVRIIHKAEQKIYESEFIGEVCEKLAGVESARKYHLCMQGILCMTSSAIMIVGTLGISKILQLPFSRATTLAVAGWTLFSYAGFLGRCFPFENQETHQADFDSDDTHFDERRGIQPMSSSIRQDDSRFSFANNTTSHFHRYPNDDSDSD